jgi:hypothetical protein
MTLAPAKPPRKWLPTEYGDEVIPSPRASPADWLLQVDGKFYLAGNDIAGDTAPRELREGEIVQFDWTEDHGTAELEILSPTEWRGEDRMPTTPGGNMVMCEAGNWESQSDNISTFVECYCDMDRPSLPAAVTVSFYAWSNAPTLYEFRAGAFHAQGAAN